MRISALLVALLACATAFAEGTAASACDGVSCGMGTCKEVPPAVPILSNVSSYECDCYPGWMNYVPIIRTTACYIPRCISSCYVPLFELPPLGSNLTLHPCLGMDCGLEGTCVEEQGKPLECQCKPGATNMLDNPSFPCTKDCVISRNGSCSVLNPPPSLPPPPLSSPPLSSPPSNDPESSGPTTPSRTSGNPSSQGSICLQNLLLLALLSALHVVNY